MLRHINRYNKLMAHYKNNPPECIYERHHIVPVCLGGLDTPDNIILLPPRAHFIAHYLLYKAFPENSKLAFAYSMMGVGNQYQHRISNGKLYEISKIARSNAMKGVPRPEWIKEKLRVPKKSNKNYFGQKSKRHRASISLSLSGKKKSKQHIENMRNSLAPHYKRRKRMRDEKCKKYKALFENFDGSRRDFALNHNINYNTMKGYLK